MKLTRQFHIFTSRYTTIEQAIYAVIWLVVLCVPMLMQFYDVLSANSPHYQWGKVWMAERHILPCLGLFLVNDLVLLPLFFRKGRRKWYAVGIVAILALYMWVMPYPPEQRPCMAPPVRPNGAPMGVPLGPPPELSVGWIFSFNLGVGLAILAINLAIFLYVKTLENARKLRELENRQTAFELDVLKYQVNPHFLMNTLNNIQALVDIDPERAQDVIQRLSQMMRFILYESNARESNLAKEVEMMRNFVELMRLRYSEDVKINADFSTGDEALTVPPLIFISFIENAFKHGVSYDRPSSIAISLRVSNGKILFTCANTVHPKTSQGKSGGLGLANVRQRLDLLYGKDYRLDISQGPRMFVVKLRIPVKVPKPSPLED